MGLVSKVDGVITVLFYESFYGFFWFVGLFFLRIVFVVNFGLVGGFCIDMGKVVDVGDDCVRDRGRWSLKDTGMLAVFMDVW